MNAKLLWQRNMLRLLLLGLVVTAVFYWTPFLWKVLGPFIVALALAAALQPAIRRLDRLRVNRSVSTLLLLVLVYAVIALLVYWFTSFVVRQAISALQNAPQWLQGINDIYQRFRAWITKMFEESDRLEQMDSLMNRAYQELTSWATTTAGSLVGTTVNVAFSLPSVLIFANFLLLGSFFLTRDFSKLFPRKETRGPLSPSMQMRRSAAEAVAGYIRMQVIYTIFVLTVSAAGFTIFGVPYGFLLASLAALLEFLPLFGNGTLYVPMIIICFLIRDYHTAFVTLGVHLILYVTRKVTEPRVMNKQMGLNPVLSLISMYVGLQTGGVVGMTLSPIVMVVLQTSWKSGFFDAAREDLKETAVWMSRFLGPAKQRENSREEKAPAPGIQTAEKPAPKAAAGKKPAGTGAGRKRNSV